MAAVAGSGVHARVIHVPAAALPGESAGRRARRHGGTRHILGEMTEIALRLPGGIQRYVGGWESDNRDRRIGSRDCFPGRGRKVTSAAAAAGHHGMIHGPQIEVWRSCKQVTGVTTFA
jgi:hypothetical protein